MNMIDLIRVDGLSATPKYKQLTNSILSAIEKGRVRAGDMMPSINELSAELEISRDTVEKGYKYLKGMGVLDSVAGKGYFVLNTDLKKTLKIFLLFNKLSAHKKIIRDAFIETLGDYVLVDFYIYDNNFLLFKRLLSEKRADYTHYVIIPHSRPGEEHAHELINAIPSDKLIILDKKIPGIRGEYAAVYEDFGEDIYNALEEARELLSKYHTIKVIFPDDTYHPLEIIGGIRRFCQDRSFIFKVVPGIADEEIKEGEVFINLMEDDLVVLIERIVALDLDLGRQVGVISYNETPLKKIIKNGITTVSTDFQEMGRMAARMVLDGSKQHEKVPFHLTRRESL